MQNNSNQFHQINFFSLIRLSRHLWSSTRAFLPFSTWKKKETFHQEENRSTERKTLKNINSQLWIKIKKQRNIEKTTFNMSFSPYVKLQEKHKETEAELSEAYRQLSYTQAQLQQGT